MAVSQLLKTISEKKKKTLQSWFFDHFDQSRAKRTKAKQSNAKKKKKEKRAFSSRKSIIFHHNRKISVLKCFGYISHFGGRVVLDMKDLYFSVQSPQPFFCGWGCVLLLS